ncbi:MAG: hypothetical protein ACYDCQ_06115, partial [Dehalococcoidia bacterium]
QLLPFRVSQTFAMHLILSFYGQYRMLRRFFKHGLERRTLSRHHRQLHAKHRPNSNGPSPNDWEKAG